MGTRPIVVWTALAALVAGTPSLSSAQSKTIDEKGLLEELERLEAEQEALDARRRAIQEQLEAKAEAPAPPEQIPAAPTDTAEPRPHLLSDVVVTGSRSEQLVSRIPTATSVVTKEQIQRGQTSLHLEESLRRVPGIRVENELGEIPSGRTRIIIRGVGTRANNPAGSGVRGVRVHVDGIPKNNAGGSAQDLTNIDLGSAQRIEVIRGPSSALYGNQSGGVVNIVSESGPDTPFLEYRQLFGSDRLFSESLKAGGRVGDLRYMASAFIADGDGFRDQSESRTTGANIRMDYAMNDVSSLRLLLGFDRRFQESPGQLTMEQFREDPEQANAGFAEGNVFSRVQEFRFGMTYNREIFGQDDLEITGYYIPRRLWPFQREPFFVPQDFINRGSNVRYLNRMPILGFGNRFTLGFDVQDTPITTGVFGRPDGGTLSARVETATTFGFYFLEEFELLPELILSASGRYDRIRFTARELSQGSDQVGRTFTEFTPKFGLTYQVSPNISIYLNYGEGFETPIIGELRRVPGGEFGFNNNLGPQETQSYEFGSRGGLWDDRILWEFAAFRQDIDDFISLAVGDLESPVFQNVTKVEQTGVELGTTFVLYRGLRLYTAYTFSDFEFGRFVDGDNDFSGNELPGVPRHALFAELSYEHRSGLNLRLELQHSGDFFVDDANSVVNSNYQVVNIRMSHQGLRLGSLEVSPFLGLNNITDETYSAFAFLNEANGRFFNPAPDFNVFGGFSIRY